MWLLLVIVLSPLDRSEGVTPGSLEEAHWFGHLATQ